MPLEPGTRLGPYEIEGVLGVGGMGEVYRAHDPRLNRAVALKLLPPDVGADPERTARFKREAQAVAALNHPYIVTIYSVEEADGAPFLTMELVEGQTLAEMIPAGGLTTDKLLRVAHGIAEALSAAHERGIVHRDLKPGNIMITVDGRVKVLDFGLAKFRAVLANSESTTQLASDLTAEGRFLGTVAYMSPEQAEGKPVDQRSDIFSLGVMLHELATGQRPFKGNTSASLISSILKDTPPLVSDVKPALPRELARVIRRCLVKDPSRRYLSVLDPRNELEEIEQEVRSGELRAPGVAENRHRHGQRLSRPALTATLVAVAIAIGLWYGTWRSNGERPSPRVQRLPLQNPAGVRIAELASPSSLAISPDGQWIVFRGTSDDPNRGDLYLRSTNELDARLVAGAREAWSPFFSPDSRWLGFHADNAMWRVPAGGGQPQRICRILIPPRGANWADDGTIVFSTGGGLLRVPADGGEPVALTSPEPGERHIWPQVLPGSEAAIFVRYQGVSDSWRKIAVVSLRTGKIVRTLTTMSGTSPRYLTSGNLLYSQFGTVYVVGFDLKRLEPTGEPAVVLEDVNFYEGSGYAAYDVAGSGALVYIPGAPRVQDAELIWIDRQGRTARAVEDRRPYRTGAATSPGGDRLAVHITTTPEDSDVWVYDVSRGSWTKLTTGLATRGNVVWSPDGRSIVFTSFQSGHGKLFRIPADGNGTPEALTKGAMWDYAGGLSPDGKVLLFTRQVEAGTWVIMTLRLDEPRSQPDLFLGSPPSMQAPRFSPHGRWIAYNSLETGRWEVHARPYPGPGGRVTLTTAGGQGPIWSRDGREVFFQRGDELWSVPVKANGGVQAGNPRLLFKPDFFRGFQSSQLGALASATADGRFLAVRNPPPERTERLLVYVTGSLEEMKRSPNGGR